MKLVTIFKKGTATLLQNWTEPAANHKFIFPHLDLQDKIIPSKLPMAPLTLFLTEILCCGFGVLLFT